MPTETHQQTNVRMPPELHARAKTDAHARGISLNQWCVEAIRHHLAQRNRRDALPSGTPAPS